MAEAFFNEVPEPDPIRWAGVDRPARVQGLRPGPARPRQAHGGPPPDRRLPLALLRLAGRRTCSASGRSTGRGSTARLDPMDGRADQDGRGVRVPSRSSACRSTASTIGTLRPRARPSRRSGRTSTRISDEAAGYQERTGVRLLWGTANLFSHPRYAAGAATNPDPEVFAYAAAQVKHMLEVDPPARRRELRAVGRPRGLRDAAEHGSRA